MKPFVCYYNTEDDKIRFYNGTEIIEVDRTPIDQYNCFHFIKYLEKHNTKDYEVTDDDLILFYNNFAIWSNELETNNIYKFNYISSFNHFFSVENFFAKFVKCDIHEKISFEESQIIDQNFNAGLTYCKKGKYKKCYSYDFSQSYGSILASDDFKFPTKSGKFINIKKIPDLMKNLQPAYYHVKITCDNTDFNKVFMFSKNHWYAHTLIKFCKEHQKQFNVYMDLIIDDKPNMYSYNRKDCISGSMVFYKWHNTLKKLKQQFPANRLIKHLSSCVWGIICHKRIKTMTADEINESDIDYSTSGEHELIDLVMTGSGSTYYKIADKNNLFRFNLRVKAFLTSWARVKMANVVLTCLDDVVRINTDGCTSLKPINYEQFEGLRIDHKLIGKIKFRSLNSWKVYN